ncbi:MULTISPECIES: hypothetical protein [Streptomyces]|uniref:C2H2-type domain-containing protein n=1 Tax=Streptomyces chartreusis NRRL 3882 TaxID=1079985 RepID=A0A2N9BD72_STRCX|nr:MULTISPECIES: hypothetical protein [Streptomyces]MYS90032.1 hypothetical protein [Streptomyces sp. SID5464]SOR81261.1 hypothetical protein SCNRRL3882_4713 [Streptomyces chartreusis NRRL 3882]
MSEITGQTGLRAGANAVVNESYSFACMRCGYGWEQSYEIEHHTDAAGHEFVLYVADGQVVPSPLSKPTCQNCDGHVVRIMRPGRVESARNAAHRPHRVPPQAGPVQAPAADAEAAGTGEQEKSEHHHWHLSDLLHPFQRKAS